MPSNVEQPRKSKGDLLLCIAALAEDDPRYMAVVAAIVGRSRSDPPSLRLLRTSDAAKATGLSRCSIWRAVRDGKIKTVKLREGGCRLIPEAELRKLAGVLP